VAEKIQSSKGNKMQNMRNRKLERETRRRT